MATPILEIPEVSTSILSFALLNIVLRHYEQAASNRIIDSLPTPPLAPADGDAYFILSGATGLWSGQDGKIAFSISGAWYFMKAIPQLPYLKTSTNTLVTLDPVTATEGVFSSGGGGSAGLTVQDESTTLGTASTVTTLNFVGAGVTATRTANTVNVSIPGGGGGGSAIGYYDLTAASNGNVSIPFSTYPAHSVASIDCSNVTADYVGLNLGLLSVTGSGGKKIEVILYNVPDNVMYAYRFGGFGGFNIPVDPVFYRNHDTFHVTYDVNFATNTIIAHNASQPDFVYESFNYNSPNVDEVVVLGQNKLGIYSYNAAFISAGGATITMTWDDTYIQNVAENLHWKITLYDIPPVVTNIVVVPPSGAISGLEGNLSKTPVSGTITFDWVFSTNEGAWIVS